MMLNVLACVYLLLVCKSEIQSTKEIFPHVQFKCDPTIKAYETEFIFLHGLGHGFTRIEPIANKIFFEYYFPIEYWVDFAAANMQCSSCYFSNYSPSSISNSNLHPNCIEECLDNILSDVSINYGDTISKQLDTDEFKTVSQSLKESLKNMHFENNHVSIGGKEFIHAKIWRKYVYFKSNNWESFCFLSIGSFSSGPNTFLKSLRSTYIGKNSTYMHCYKANDIKVDCDTIWVYGYSKNNKFLLMIVQVIIELLIVFIICVMYYCIVYKSSLPQLNKLQTITMMEKDDFGEGFIKEISNAVNVETH